MLNQPEGMVIELNKNIHNPVTRQSSLRTESQLINIFNESDKAPPHSENHGIGGNDRLTPANIGAASVENLEEHIEENNPHAKSQKRNGGKTSERPSEPKNYEFYFDTDLGHPIWYDGENWVDYEGNTVDVTHE